jgi:predicted nucleic acid-binding protein
VIDAVLDASVILKWFRSEGETDLAAALALREAFEAGQLRVFVPPLIFLEALDVAGRSWLLPEPDLLNFAAHLGTAGLDVREARLDSVARWTARGQTAYDASYVALAEEQAVPLITADQRIVDTAAAVASPLGTSALELG